MPTHAGAHGFGWCLLRLLRDALEREQDLLRLALVLSVLALEAWIDEQGWDQPAQIFAVYGVEGTEDEDLRRRFESVLLGEGDPYEVLAESDLDDDVAALICSAELWAFPPDLPEEECVGRPSERTIASSSARSSA